MPKKRKKHTGRKILVGVLVTAIFFGGASAILYLSDRMAETTRSGQRAAVFAADKERLSYSILGQEGEIVWRDAAERLREDFTALPARGRLLLWGAAAARQFWREDAKPFLLHERPRAPQDGTISLV